MPQIGSNYMAVFGRPQGNLPNNFAGSAVMTADQPIVAVVNTFHTGSGDTKSLYTASNR